MYGFEGFRLDAQRRVLFGLDGQPIPLTPRLFDTLLYFVERAGQLLTKEQLLEALWPNLVVEEHNLNTNISELRRTLGEKPGEHRFIVTKPGRGYRFVAAVSVISAGAAGSAELEVGATVASASRASRAARFARHAFWVGGVAAAVAVGATLYGFLASSPDPALRVTPWSVKKGTQWFPVWSPDGASTAFVTFGGAANEPPELVVRDLGEPIGRRIASRPPNDPGGVTQWTTTGKIQFFDVAGLWSISPVGGSFEPVVRLDWQQLGIGNRWLRAAHVTTDGAALAMFGSDGGASVGIWTATPPSAPPQRYEPAPFAGATLFGGPWLRFSQSGRQLLLAFYAANRGFEMWLMPFPADARNPPRRVFENVPIVGDSVEFSWFPDDRHIALAATVGVDPQSARRQLYVADTQTGALRALPVSFNAPGGPAISPDGEKLIVGESRSDFDIVTLDLDTAAVSSTIATVRSEILPAWAANADAMVYATDRAGAWEIWLHQEPRPDRPLATADDFATETLFLFAPTLSPEGERVVYHRVGVDSESRLWISAVAGGDPEPLTNEDLTERAGAWSPNGDWYVYWASPRDGGTRTLKRVRTTGRATPEALLEDLSQVDLPAPIWSPDGKWILVGHRGLTLVSADGEASRMVTSETMPCAFAEHEPLLYCIRGSLGPIPMGEYALVELDFDGNVHRTSPIPAAYRPVSQLAPGIRLSPTPDRRGVSYSVATGSLTLWLVEGLETVNLL